jgi:small conductance mechanosensitive channel
VDIRPVLAGAGIIGLAVGFGAQNLIRDLISGFFIILEDQVHLGDVAINTLSNMTKGWSAFVLDMGVAYKEDTDRVAAVMKRVGEACGPLTVEVLGGMSVAKV